MVQFQEKTMNYKWVICQNWAVFNILNQIYSLIEFFMGFQNIIKLLKSDEQNLNYKPLKLWFV